MTDLDEQVTQRALAWQPLDTEASWERIVRRAHEFRHRASASERLVVGPAPAKPAQDPAIYEFDDVRMLHEACHRVCALYVAGLDSFHLQVRVDPLGWEACLSPSFYSDFFGACARADPPFTRRSTTHNREVGAVADELPGPARCGISPSSPTNTTFGPQVELGPDLDVEDRRHAWHRDRQARARGAPAAVGCGDGDLMRAGVEGGGDPRAAAELALERGAPDDPRGAEAQVLEVGDGGEERSRHAGRKLRALGRRLDRDARGLHRHPQPAVRAVAAGADAVARDHEEAAASAAGQLAQVDPQPVPPQARRDRDEPLAVGTVEDGEGAAVAIGVGRAPADGDAPAEPAAVRREQRHVRRVGGDADRPEHALALRDLDPPRRGAERDDLVDERRRQPRERRV